MSDQVVVVIVHLGSPVIGRVSWADSVRLTIGEHRFSAGQWDEIMVRYRAGLEPLVNSGQISVSPSPSTPEASEPSISEASAFPPLPSVRLSRPIVEAETDEAALLCWLGDSRSTIRKMVLVRLEELRADK